VSYEEGLRRIGRAIRWIGDTVAALLALWAIVALLDGIFSRSSDGAIYSGIVFAVAAIVLAGGRLVEWVIKGFAEPSSKR
jgi:hypothetical protein